MLMVVYCRKYRTTCARADMRARCWKKKPCWQGPRDSTVGNTCDSAATGCEGQASRRMPGWAASRASDDGLENGASVVLARHRPWVMGCETQARRSVPGCS